MPRLIASCAFSFPNVLNKVDIQALDTPAPSISDKDSAVPVRIALDTFANSPMFGLFWSRSSYFWLATIDPIPASPAAGAPAIVAAMAPIDIGSDSTPCKAISPMAPI